MICFMCTRINVSRYSQAYVGQQVHIITDYYCCEYDEAHDYSPVSSTVYYFIYISEKKSIVY